MEKVLTRTVGSHADKIEIFPELPFYLEIYIEGVEVRIYKT